MAILIKSNDIFFLYETWVLSTDFRRHEKYVERYKLTWVSALRNTRFGRASGGVLVGCKIKKEDRRVRVSHEFEKPVLMLNLRVKKWWCRIWIVIDGKTIGALKSYCSERSLN